MNVLFFENLFAHFPSRISYVTVYIAAWKVLQSSGRLRVCDALRNTDSFSGCLSSCRIIFYTFCEVVRSSLGASIFFSQIAIHKLCARLISRPSTDSTFNRRWNFCELARNSCERTMISKFVLSNGRRCCATHKTTSELNVVSSYCCIILFRAKKHYSAKNY